MACHPAPHSPVLYWCTAMSDKPELQTKLREIAESLLCRDGVSHYCPKCDNTTFDAAMSLKSLADQIRPSPETPPASNTVAFLKARFADEGMPWSRPHIESLIEQIDKLTKQRDEGCQAFNNLRKQVGEDRYPGMTAPVRPAHETFDDSATLASMADKLRAIAIRDESRGLSTTGLESAAREIEWAARRDRASMKAGERLDAVLGDRPRPRPNVDEMGTPTPCSTCNGTGEVDESLGGSPGSNRHAPCPDCSGT